MDMISSVTNLMNSKYRMTGLASGLDTDTIVKQLLKPEYIKVDRFDQKRQIAEWKRDVYRNIYSSIKALNDGFLDVLQTSNNMLSPFTYKKFTAASTDSTVVTAAGTPAAIPGSHTVTVNSLATAATAVGSGIAAKPLQSTIAMTASDILNASGKNIKVTLDGITKEITLGTYTAASTAADVANDIQARIGTAFGTGKVNVTGAGNQLLFATTGGTNKITLNSGTVNDGLAYLHFSPGASNRLDTSKTLGGLAISFTNGLTFDASNNLAFTINGKAFTFSSSTTLAGMMSAINNDPIAGVNISYDETADNFKITSKQTGAGSAIQISQSAGSFFGTTGASQINISSIYSGTDAAAVIDGVSLTRSSNTFAVNGVTYNLLKPSATQQTITITPDADGVVASIKNFVNKYNEVIDLINKKLSEKYDGNYPPLTDEQKKGMSEADIKKWEDKAKTGLLQNDSILQNIADKVRRALSDKVSGLSVDLSGIGITTGAYQNKGKLFIDEAKLKAAIQTNPDSVMNLFSTRSTTVPVYSRTLTSAQRTARYNEEGLAYRLYDVIQDNISTLRDGSGRKGILLEKAGIAGDPSELASVLSFEIKGYSTKISEINSRIAEKSSQYYLKFSALEKYISQMNAQSNWLNGQLRLGK